jgi:predicted phosphodiesterase
MRIAVISDIHGNCLALDAALADIRRDGLERIVCLGDAIQGGGQAAGVVARLRELACPGVMGKSADWGVKCEENGSESFSAERLRKMHEVREWSLAQLSDDDRAFIAQFQPTIGIALGERALLCFHGSPASFDDIILPTTSEEQFQAYLGAYVPRILCGGHTHMQQIRRIGASDSFFFNPGSIGLAYSHQQPEDRFRADPWAEYAVLSVENGRIALDLRRVPVDAQTLIAVYQASGRPHAEDAVAQYQ